MDSSSSVALDLAQVAEPSPRKIERRISDTHGAGVFATSLIEKGEAIVTFTGPIAHRSKTDFDDYHLQIGAEHYMGPSGDLDDYVNHSCDPNAGFKDGLVLVARRDIAAGEEITMDYGAVIDEDDFSGMVCRCGATHCRGMITSFRHLSDVKKQALKPWLLPYLLDKYYGARLSGAAGA